MSHFGHGAPLTAAETLAVGVKLGGALETAHRAGVLHRDIKPGNILLTEYGEPQLTDFGIARITGGEETTRGLVAGSPAYTAPELLSGSDASVVTDVYGLGATLFTALAGRPAFARRRGEQVFAQLLRISSEPLPDLRDEGVPEAVCEVIESAMARDPAERPTTAADLGAALREAGEHIGLAMAGIPLPIVGDDDRPFRPTDEVGWACRTIFDTDAAAGLGWITPRHRVRPPSTAHRSHTRGGGGAHAVARTPAPRRAPAPGAHSCTRGVR